MINFGKSGGSGSGGSGSDGGGSGSGWKIGASTSLVIATLENQRTSSIQSNWSGENILYTGTVRTVQIKS